ncbi:unnamed protein product [Linum trigynum]|uniref:Uncharacterized protein n=1 Tax=Linum trigynum TaxID=586398 RepID=A0AAV2DA12_9ROSI
MSSSWLFDPVWTRIIQKLDAICADQAATVSARGRGAEAAPGTAGLPKARARQATAGAQPREALRVAAAANGTALLQEDGGPRRLSTKGDRGVATVVAARQGEAPLAEMADRRRASPSAAASEPQLTTMIGEGVAVLTVVAPTFAAAVISEEKGSGVASTVAMEPAVGVMATRARPEVCRSPARPPVDPPPRKKETKVKNSIPEMVKK